MSKKNLFLLCVLLVVLFWIASNSNTPNTDNSIRLSNHLNDDHTGHQIEAQSRELVTQQNILIDQDIDLEKLASVMNQGMNHVEVIPFDSEEFT
ncbi:hypothetical protein [Bacillus horti]|uniref:Uncharacterized protein n=1 Tax=Caldalkalibacillus horti TaxID=77523 RepID=A0ABT9W1T6_9BACI|nr:hypothetical protein [Bacillus horti]MDQ0167075.1 hypothetical protein [Bacillus horti]